MIQDGISITDLKDELATPLTLPSERQYCQTVYTEALANSVLMALDDVLRAGLNTMEAVSFFDMPTATLDFQACRDPSALTQT